MKIKIANYKCYSTEPQGFDELKQINLVIGRNNAGKSSLVDAVRFAIENIPKLPSNTYHKARIPALYVSTELTETDLRQVFQEHASHGAITGNHWQYGKKWIGSYLTKSIDGKEQRAKFEAVDPPFEEIKHDRKGFEDRLTAATLTRAQQSKHGPLLHLPAGESQEIESDRLLLDPQNLRLMERVDDAFKKISPKLIGQRSVQDKLTEIIHEDQARGDP